MLTKIFEDLLELIGGVLRDAVNLILGHLNMDMSTMEEAMPVLKGCVTTMVVLGTFIVVSCALAEAIQLTAQPITGQEKKGGAFTFARIALAAALSFGIVPLMRAIMPTLQNLYDVFLKISDIGATANFGTLEEQATGASILQDFSYGPIFGPIIIILILFQFFKIAASMFTRYITFGVCIYISPICMAFGASESTSNIPKAWAKTFFSQIILFFLTGWAVNAMYNSLITWDSASNTEYWFFFVKCMIIYMFGKLILKLDEYLAKLGFNTMPTAASMGGGAALMISSIARTIGMLRGGGGRTGSSGAARGDRSLRMDTKFDENGMAKASTKIRGQGGFTTRNNNEEARSAYNKALINARYGSRHVGELRNRHVEQMFGPAANSNGRIRLDPTKNATMDQYGGIQFEYSENVGGNAWEDKTGYISPDGVQGVFQSTQGGGADGHGVRTDSGVYLDRSKDGFEFAGDRYTNLNQGATMREIRPIQVHDNPTGGNKTSSGGGKRNRRK